MDEFRWYFTAPRFGAALAARVAVDGVRVGEGTIEASGAALVTAGCVRDERWQRGQLVARTSVDALIAAGRRDELARCAADAAFFQLAGKTDPAIVYLLVHAFGDGAAVRARLAAQPATVASRCATAKAWQHLLHDAEAAGRELQAAESESKSAADFLACAEAWMSVRGDQAALRRCLNAADARASKLDDVVAVSLQRGRLADDSDGAARGLERAGTLGADSETAITCARAWRSLLTESEAQKAMRDAEARAKDGADWAACATAHLEIFGDDAAARRCLSEATARAGWRWAAAAWMAAGNEAAARGCLDEAGERADTETLAGCAATWKDVLGDAERGRRCLSQAESRATGTRAWAACAAAWKRTFADDGEMRRCLGEMEKHARETAEWSECAAYSFEAGDAEGARRCLANGQKAAKSSADFASCARIWHRLQPGAPEAAQLLAEADTRADDIAALVNVATEWHGLAADGGKARAALGRAEALAQEKGGWSSIAHAWARTLGDRDAARRCLGEAEKRATEAAHWGALGVAFERILDDADESRRCRVREMELQAGGDLVECARGWRRILADAAEARRRLKDKESGANGVEAWQSLSAAWRSVFGDDAEAARADEWVERWKTVQRALDARDWTAFARTWREILPEEPEARRRLQDAEQHASTMVDWTAFARAWKRVFEDDAETRRCMLEAEGKARFKSDWKVCGEAWRDVGEYAEAQRCSEHR
jgi:hypothetical protein